MGRFFALRTLLGGTAATVIVLATAYAAAEVYVYTDKHGVTHFTNVPKHSGYKRVSWYDLDKKIDWTLPGKSYTRHKGPSALRKADRTRYDKHIEDAAKFYNLPFDFVKAVIAVESDFDAEAVSPAGAQGLMQLMPGTAERMNVANAFDARDNIFGGTRYLRFLADMFEGDIVLMLAGYNAGENAVVKAGGVPNLHETRRYVRKILKLYAELKKAREGSGKPFFAKN